MFREAFLFGNISALLYTTKKARTISAGYTNIQTNY